MLDDPALAGGIRSLADMLQKYLQSDYFKADILLQYADKMNNNTIFKRSGYLLSILKPDQTTLIKKCEAKISQSYSQIDPSLKGSHLVRKWWLRMPDDFENTF